MTTDSDLLPDLVTTVPGPRSRALAQRLLRVECADTTCMDETSPIFWERAAGCNVWDVDGNRFVDLGAAFGVCILGHGHPALRAALAAQAPRLVHAMGDVHPAALKVELAETLSRLAPGNLAVVIFGSSGSDAIEAALKTAQLVTGKPGAVAFEGAYHGLGFGALGLTWREHFRAPFRSQLNPHVVHLPYPGRPGPPGGEGTTAAAVLERLDALLASPAGAALGAVVVEPIQGRGGIVVPDADFLPGLREICTRRARLLVADEILTGCGRTGSWFACESSGVVPDLLCVGKSLAGGLPLSACIGTPEVMGHWERSRGEARHTQTFLGNPLACAVAIATLEVLEREGWPARVATRGAAVATELQQTLAGHAGVSAIRGRGWMWGIECTDRAGKPDTRRVQALVRATLQRGIIVLAAGDAGNVLELLPPYVLGRAPWDAACALLDELFERIPPTP